MTDLCSCFSHDSKVTKTNINQLVQLSRYAGIDEFFHLYTFKSKHNTMNLNYTATFIHSNYTYSTFAFCFEELGEIDAFAASPS